jgi:hypothetical protein
LQKEKKSSLKENNSRLVEKLSPFMVPDGFHRNPPLVPVFNQMNPANTSLYYLFRLILVLFVALQLGVAIGIFLSGFLT